MYQDPRLLLKNFLCLVKMSRLWIRTFGSYCKQSFTKAWNSLDQPSYLQSSGGSLLRMFIITLISVSSPFGTIPSAISIAVMPIDHMSAFWQYPPLSWSKTYGAIQQGEPINSVSFCSGFTESETPKSPRHIWPAPLRRIFWDLMSLWILPFEWKYCTPSQSYFKIVAIKISSLIPFWSKLFLRHVRTLSTDPASRYGITSQSSLPCIKET